MSVKKNFVYNVLLTMSSYIVSLVVFPYVSRILGVSILGRLSFVSTIVSYFSLFALLGVSAVGIRAIASCGNNREQRTKTFASIFSFILLLTILSLLIFVCCIFFVPKFRDYQNLLFIGSLSLFFTSLLIEWLYQGIEKFKYISVRTIIVRCIYAISVFVFIKSKDDYLLYYVLTTGTVIINAIINIVYARNFINFNFRSISVFKYAKEILSIGVYKILTSMYTTFNVVYLGFVATENQVGFYTTSTKLFYIQLGILSAFTSVMLPRMSSLLAEGKRDEYKSKIDYSFDLVFMFTIPIIVWTLFYAPQIIRIISGKGFEGAITPMRIITPMLFITGIAQIFVVQTLMPLKKDKIILVGSIVGATVGILSNILFVKQYGAVGTAITLLLAEIFGDLVGFVYAIYCKLIEFPWHRLYNYLIGGIPYVAICMIVNTLETDDICRLFLSIVCFSIYFGVFNYAIMKNAIIISSVKSTIKRL